MLPLAIKDSGLFGPVRRVEYEFAEFEEKIGESIEIRTRSAGYELYDREGRILEQISAERNLIDQVYKDVFFYNDTGQVIEHRELDENERIENKCFFEYEDDGTIIETGFFSLNRDETFSLGWRRYYDTDRNIIRDIWYDEQGEEIQRTESVISQIVGNAIDTVSNIASTLFFGGKHSDNNRRETVTERDSRGNEIELSCYEDDQKLVIKETYDYEFDTFDNWTTKLTKRWVDGWGEYRLRPFTITRRKIEYFSDLT